MISYRDAAPASALPATICGRLAADCLDIHDGEGAGLVDEAALLRRGWPLAQIRKHGPRAVAALRRILAERQIAARQQKPAHA